MSAIEESDNEAPSGGAATQEDLALFDRLKKYVSGGQRARSAWRKEAVRAFDFVANIQWSEDDKQLLNDQHRPAVTFNRAAPIIKAICGLEVNNRQTVTYLPREQGDAEADEAITDTAKWMRDECNAEDEESEAFNNLVICGEGWTDTIQDFDDDPKGKYNQLRVDPLEMGVFEGSTRANYEDKRGVYRIREMSLEDAKDLFDGDIEASDLHAAWLDPSTTPSDGGQGNKQDYPAETRAALERTSGRPDKVRLVQVQWWEREPLHLVAEQGADKLQEMNDQEFSTYSSRVSQLQEASPDTAPVYDHVAVKKKVYYQAFLGNKLLEPKKMKIQEFSFRCMTGYRDRTGKCFYGMLRDIFDPQMWANKWLSQTMHIMNTNAKGGIMAETDAFVNVRKAEKDWADNTKIIWVKPGGLEKNKIKERTPPPLPQGLGELMTFALSAIRDVTGVNLELIGQADREQAASLEAQRRQSAMTMLATMFDSLRKYRKSQGRLTLHFMQLIPPGTLIRVLSQGKAKYVPFIKSKDAECYDVIIDEAPSSPDQKMAIWAITMQLLQQGIPLSPPTIIALLKYSPYPESVVNEIAESMGLGQTMPPQVLKQRLDQAEQALQVLEAKYKEALDAAQSSDNEEAIKLLELEIDEYKAKTARIQAELTYAAALKRNENEINAAAITALAPQPGGEDGEGGPPGASPDLLQAILQKMEMMSGHIAQLMPQPTSTPPQPEPQPQPDGAQPQ